MALTRRAVSSSVAGSSGGRELAPSRKNANQENMAAVCLGALGASSQFGRDALPHPLVVVVWRGGEPVADGRLADPVRSGRKQPR